MSQFYEIFNSYLFTPYSLIFVIIVLIIYYEQRIQFYKKKEKRLREEIIVDTMMDEFSTLLEEANKKMIDKHKE